MGKLFAVLLPLLTTWALLAKIFPDWFEVRKDRPAWKVVSSPQSRWVAVILLSVLGGYYVWSLEERLSSGSGTPGKNESTVSADETGLQFASWGPTPDGAGCTAAIDASKLPAAFKDKYDIALVCGFADPNVDRLKDTRISLSTLFTPQMALQISEPFTKTMADALASEQRAAIEKLNPRPAKGTPIGVMSFIWFKLVLLPKGTDRSNVQKLSDVTVVGGKIALAETSVGISRPIAAP
jgi:hypothetical protein